MGKEAKRNNRAKMEAGVLQVRIGPKKKSKVKREEERRRSVFLPVKKGEPPLAAVERADLFERARKARAEVAIGIRDPGPVDIAEVGLPGTTPDVAELLLDVALKGASTRGRIARHHPTDLEVDLKAGEETPP